jgi:hypothetical protein
MVDRALLGFRRLLLRSARLHTSQLLCTGLWIFVVSALALILDLLPDERVRVVLDKA